MNAARLVDMSMQRAEVRAVGSGYLAVVLAAHVLGVRQLVWPKTYDLVRSRHTTRCRLEGQSVNVQSRQPFTWYRTSRSPDAGMVRGL